MIGAPFPNVGAHDNCGRAERAVPRFFFLSERSEECE